MRRFLGTVLLVPLLLAGCGSEGGPTATDPETESTSETTSAPPTDDQAEAVLVELVSGTAAGGQASDTLVEVDDEQALTAFASQFRGDLGEKVRTSVQAAADKHDTMYVGVVSVGCDIPPGVQIEQGPDEIRATPDKVTDPLEECLAAVTTVAVVALG